MGSPALLCSELHLVPPQVVLLSEFVCLCLRLLVFIHKCPSGRHDVRICSVNEEGIYSLNQFLEIFVLVECLYHYLYLFKVSALH